MGTDLRIPYSAPHFSYCKANMGEIPQQRDKSNIHLEMQYPHQIN
jgi:hypothetical protein